MIKHYLTLEHIARALDDRLRNAEVLEIFTQEKHVVTLCFLRGRDEIVVTASVDPQYGTITERTNIHRARRNSLDLFPTLVGRRCTAVRKHPHDRIVSIDFDGVVLHVLLYGGAKGNILVERDGIIMDALRGARTLVGSTLPPVESSTPPLGRWYAAEVEHGVDVLAACRATDTYYVLGQGAEVLFSLIPLHGWQVLEETQDIFTALRRTIGLRRTRHRCEAMRQRLLAELRRRHTRVQRSLLAMQQEMSTMDRAVHYRHTGDLLMAAPSPRRSGLDSVELDDWNGGSAQITLDPRKTLIENAAAYYEKARRSEQAAETRRRRIPAFTQRRDELEALLERVRFTEDVEDLERLSAEFMTQRQDASQEEARFRTFVLDGTYTLYVGRNAANNDELTMRFAKQNDWWFHARGVSGSHAVLRGGGNERPPKSILAQAAALAAWYSQARNASYTPVVYTQRKYVRKPKGANVGAVTLEREQVIMVRPAGPDTD